MAKHIKPPVEKPSARQAVIIVHGMGEQIPMETLNSFVDAVWTNDLSLIDNNQPDGATGKVPRTINPVWSKPDDKSGSFELRRRTTEKSSEGWSTDFFEYYWAHQMHGTAWAHISAWLTVLLFRAPKTVPRKVASAWIALWIAVFIVIGCILALFDYETRTWIFREFWHTLAFFSGVAIVSIFTQKVLLSRFGDVARYVQARPPNVGRRQEIRENGVALLENILRAKRSNGKPVYDRVIVVAHSLGSIVAYDMLTHCFARFNKQLPDVKPQPARVKLEQMTRAQLGIAGAAECKPEADFTTAYQAQQKLALQELVDHGCDWRVSDFVTLGSPLTHAEFLLARNWADLLGLQSRRVLPTCPPILEFDLRSGFQFMSYRPYHSDMPLQVRIPHHAAVFGFTRWTNLYSPQSYIVRGDIVSGPVGDQFALRIGTRVAQGVRDIPVLEKTYVSHNNYWKFGAGHKRSDAHIQTLRDVLDLNQKLPPTKD